jgi:hypothetical protein
MKLSLAVCGVTLGLVMSVGTGAAEVGEARTVDASRALAATVSTTAAIVAEKPRATDTARARQPTPVAPPRAATVEPSTLGLMVAGLALIGLMLLRRLH